MGNEAAVRAGARGQVPDIGLPTDRAGQVTMVEQARAVAEVQAAVVVAQNVPRDMLRAENEMKQACGRIEMAKVAFYAVPNRGNGPSVHLARELARIFGNVQYGVHELRRDDAAGMSEIQAFAWDVQTNVRSTRTFVVPHARMARRERQALTDLGDIYSNNQNQGARALRECIFSALPRWFVDTAVGICRRTLETGESGVPLSEQITSMVKAFDELGIDQKRIEAERGRQRGAWHAGDVADLRVAYQTISNDRARADDLFPPTDRVSADDLKPSEGQ